MSMQEREPQHHHHQGGGDHSDMGHLDPGDLHAVPDHPGPAAQQEGEGQLPGAHQRGGGDLFLILTVS